MVEITRLAEVAGVWRIAEGRNVGYLAVRKGKSLLVDCPVVGLGRALRKLGLPVPESVVHTQVQEEHCREWASFPQAKVWLPTGTADIAGRTAAFRRDCRTVWPPSREWETRGAEKYGFAGCTTARPPRRALAVAGELKPGKAFRWQGLKFEVLPLPGSDPRAIGLYWREAGVLFSGDLLEAGGYLVNFYDLERAYGLDTGYQELDQSLARAAALQPRFMLPTTGAPITEPARDLARLRTAVAEMRPGPRRRAEQAWALTSDPAVREFGRYREVRPGVYQNTNFGNVCLFVDARGRGLMVDPDSCVWKSWEENCREWHADLDLLERETGLKTVEFALITHYHGDHLEYSDLLRQRYGTVIATTPDVAAVCERPEKYRYPSAIDWYGFPFKRLKIDRRLAYDRVLRWHQTPVRPLWTPGHCNAHASYLVTWQGVRILCAGDVIQYGHGALAAEVPICWNDNAWPDRGTPYTFSRLAEIQPQVVLGGHSHFFNDPDGSILRDMRDLAVAACERFRGLVVDGDLMRAMTPPGYDRLRPSRELPRP